MNPSVRQSSTLSVFFIVRLFLAWKLLFDDL
jgi:hypothetical protein